MNLETNLHMVNICMQKFFRFGKSNLKPYRQEFKIVAYIALLEYKKANNIIITSENIYNKEIYEFMISAVHKEAFKIIRNKATQINAVTKVNEKHNLTYAETITDKSIYFESYDFEFLTNCIKNVLKFYN